MELKTLQSLPPSEASGLLANAALATLGLDSDDAGLLTTDERESANALVAEVRTALNIDPADTTQDSLLRVTNAIESQLVRSVLRGRPHSKVLEGAGQGGRLPLSQYSLDIPKHFRVSVAKYGVHKTTVARALEAPDDVQHLMPESQPDDDGLVFSLFVKQMPRRGTLPPHWLLVQTIRKGASLTPQFAWWIHPSLVEIGAAATPLDLLRAFAAKFGVPIVINGANFGTFVETTTLPKPPGAPGQFNVGFLAPKVGQGVEGTWSWRSKEEWDHVIVGNVYGIDVSRYLTELRRIGAV